MFLSNLEICYNNLTFFHPSISCFHEYLFLFGKSWICSSAQKLLVEKKAILAITVLIQYLLQRRRHKHQKHEGPISRIFYHSCLWFLRTYNFFMVKMIEMIMIEYLEKPSDTLRWFGWQSCTVALYSSAAFDINSGKALLSQFGKVKIFICVGAKMLASCYSVFLS